MRKTSQDGGDTTSITSGVENETKKPGLIKTKKNSIKRKVQGLSHESDDTVIEPLLQKDMDKTDTSNQSAKYEMLSKTKTEAIIEMDNDKQKLLQDGYADTFISMPSTSKLPKPTNGTAPLHNHMNVNVFSSHDALKGLITTKSQILVEIDGSKQSGYNPSPLIFTTAKIHTDGKNKHMEPLQVTPAPILSTIEVSVLKGKNVNNSGDTSGVVTSNISPVYENIPKSNANIQDKGQKIKCTLAGVTTMQSSKVVDSKASDTTVKQFTSAVMPAKDKTALNTESIAIKEFNVGSKSAVININDNKPTENKPGNIEMNKDSKQTKLSISQPVSGTSLIDAKTIVSKPTNKVSVQTSAINQADKNVVRNELEQSNQNKKIENLNISQRRTDLNKNITQIDNQNSIIKDKGLTNTTLTGTKQLQRQKIAIDKDDTATKSKPDDGASVSKNIIQIKSTANDVIQLNDKSKSLVSTANNIQMSGGTTITKPLEPNIITTTKNKSITSTLPTTSIVKSHTSRSVSNKPSTSGMLVSSKTTSSSQPVDIKITAKDLTSVTKSAPQTILAKPADLSTKVSTTSTAKNAAAVINIAKSSTSNINTEQSSGSTTAKSLPAVICTTKSPAVSTTITPKSLPVTSSTGKKAPVTTTTANTLCGISGFTKIPLVTTDNESNSSTTIVTAKNQAIAACTEYTPSTSTSTSKTSAAKSEPATTGSAKIAPVTTSYEKTPPVKKNLPASTTSAKIPPVITGTVTSPLTATNTAKSIPISTNTGKSPSVATMTVKSPALSTNTSRSATNSIKTPSASGSKLPTTKTTTPTSKTSVTSPTSKTSVTSPALSSTISQVHTVSTTAPSSSSTSNSVVSLKKPEAKSTELRNGNKSLKP